MLGAARALVSPPALFERTRDHPRAHSAGVPPRRSLRARKAHRTARADALIPRALPPRAPFPVVRATTGRRGDLGATFSFPRPRRSFAAMRRRGSDAVGDAKPVFSFTGAGLDDGWGPSGDAAARRRAAPVSPRRPRVRMAHRAVASDVTLAMLVSNNVYFSTCWWVATVASTFAKTNGARRDFDDIRPIMIAMFMLFEPARLYAGFAGNLQEKVRCCSASSR